MKLWLVAISLMMTSPAWSESGSANNNSYFKKVSLRVCGKRYVKVMSPNVTQWVPQDTCEDVSVPGNGLCLSSNEHMKNAIEQLNRYMAKYRPDDGIADMNLRLEHYYSRLFTFRSVEKFQIEEGCPASAVRKPSSESPQSIADSGVHSYKTLTASNPVNSP